MDSKKYMKYVVNLKNGYGKSICAIAQENLGETELIINNATEKNAYIYTKKGQYASGVKFSKGFKFKNILPNESAAVILGGFDEKGKVTASGYIGFTSKEVELMPYLTTKNTENSMSDSKFTAKTEAPVLQNTENILPKGTNLEKEVTPVEIKKVSDINPFQVDKEYAYVKKENSAADNLKKIIQSFANEMKDLETRGILKKDDMTFIETGKKITSCEKDIFAKRQALHPFNDDTWQWVGVNSAEMWRFNIKDSKCIINTLVMLAETKYHHLALGRNKETGTLIFAVPEKFDEKDRKTAESLGFKDFWFCNRENSDFGYWVMDI